LCLDVRLLLFSFFRFLLFFFSFRGSSSGGGAKSSSTATLSLCERSILLHSSALYASSSTSSTPFSCAAASFSSLAFCFFSFLLAALSPAPFSWDLLAPAKKSRSAGKATLDSADASAPFCPLLRFRLVFAVCGGCTGSWWPKSCGFATAPDEGSFCVGEFCAALEDRERSLKTSIVCNVTEVLVSSISNSSRKSGCHVVLNFWLLSASQKVPVHSKL
jgi:hypothetical protein